MTFTIAAAIQEAPETPCNMGKNPAEALNASKSEACAAYEKQVAKVQATIDEEKRAICNAKPVDNVKCLCY